MYATLAIQASRLRLCLVTPAELSQSLVGIVQSIVDGRRQAAQGEDAAPAPATAITAADVVLERPKNRDHGDWHYEYRRGDSDCDQ